MRKLNLSIAKSRELFKFKLIDFKNNKMFLSDYIVRKLFNKKALIALTKRAFINIQIFLFSPCF